MNIAHISQKLACILVSAVALLVGGCSETTLPNDAMLPTTPAARVVQTTPTETLAPAHVLPSPTMLAPQPSPRAALPSPTLTAAPPAERLRAIVAATAPRDYLGSPDFYSASLDVKNFDCFGERSEEQQQACLREAGLYYEALYRDLPYMWGGNSPYAYSVAAALMENGDPFLNLKPVELMKVEEDRAFAGLYAGRSGRPMKAGFDCSGFTYWIMAHAGQPDFLAGRCADAALAAQGYYRCDSPTQLLNGRVIPEVGEGRVPLSQILRWGQPGDLIFTEEHVMFYLGGGEVVQSSDVELIGGPDNPAPPQAWLQEWAALHPTLKMVQRGGVNRTALEHMGTSFWIRRYTLSAGR